MKGTHITRTTCIYVGKNAWLRRPILKYRLAGGGRRRHSATTDDGDLRRTHRPESVSLDISCGPHTFSASLWPCWLPWLLASFSVRFQQPVWMHSSHTCGSIYCITIQVKIDWGVCCVCHVFDFFSVNIFFKCMLMN